MPKRIEAPDGSIVEFPDSMSDGQIAAVMRKEYGGPKSSGRSNTGIGFVDRSNDKSAARYEAMQERGAANRQARAAGQNPIFQPGKDLLAPAQNALSGLAEYYRDPNPASKRLPRSVGEAVNQVVDGEKRSWAAAGNALGLAFSPIMGIADAAILKPAARGLEQLGIGDEQENSNILNTALMGARPGVRAARPARTAKPRTELQETVASFDRAGIEPNLASAKGRGAASVTNSIAENAIAGYRPRARLAAQSAQAGASADRRAAGYGVNRGRQNAGEGVQAGVQRFANDGDTAGTFKARSGELYDNAFAPIEAAEAAAVQAAAGKPVIGSTQSSALLRDVIYRTNSPALSAIITDPRLKTIATALEADAGALRFGDLRALRTWVREAQGNQQLRQNISKADLSRLEGALTTDIHSAAATLGGPKALNDLRRADQYYRAGSARIENALKPFDKASSGESAYKGVIEAASSAGSADIRKVVALKRSLAPNEWGDVAATVISELGRPTAGVAGVADDAFSVSSFMTNYNKLSPRGREALFGSLGGGGSRATSLKAELDNLASVVDKLKSVERGANASKTSVNAQNLVSVGALLNPATTLPTAQVLGSVAGVGEIMTNPAFVRWLARTPKNPKAMPAHLGKLDALVATYPQLSGYREQLRKELNAEMGQHRAPENYQIENNVEAQLQPAP